MTLNCSLIKPEYFQFNAVSCDNNQINNECQNNGQSRVIFDIDMPTTSNAAVAKISLFNNRTFKNDRHTVTISEYNCSCSTLCIENTGYKKNNKYTITILFNNLIPGDRYTGSACLEYIS